MRKARLVFIGVLILSVALIGCENKITEKKVSAVSNGDTLNVLKQSENNSNSIDQNNKSENNNTSEVNKKIESGKDINSVTDSIYKNLYIGEAFTSGYVYIEPFSVNRFEYDGEEIKIANYSKSTKLFAIYNGNSFESIYDSNFSVYVPDVESDSKYFPQSFSKPKQFGLRYKLTNKIREQSQVISLLNYEILNSDLSVRGEKRTYSIDEYNTALKEIKIDKETRDSDNPLSNIELDSTIAGAEEIGLFSIKDSDIKILLSEYNTHSFENAAIVYVIDFIKDNKVIKTYQKYNWYGV